MMDQHTESIKTAGDFLRRLGELSVLLGGVFLFLAPVWVVGTTIYIMRDGAPLALGIIIAVLGVWFAPQIGRIITDFISNKLLRDCGKSRQ